MKAMRLGAVAPLAVFLGLVGLLAAGLLRGQAPLPSPLVGGPVPAFELPDLKGGAAVTPQRYAGQPWALNVWASWCLTCQVEMPYLERLAAAGVTIVGLGYKDDQDEARAWLARFGDPFVAHPVDADGAVGLDLGVYGVPETFIIDAAGTVAHKHVGAIDDERDYEDFMRQWDAVR